MIYTNDFFAAGSTYPNDNLVQLVDSFTNENVNFKKVTLWHDGTAMNPSKADGIIYRQKGNDYYVDVDWLANRTVYVKRFGAVGDGITNDAPAIRKMISFLPQRDFIVVFENAKYMQGDGSFTDRYPLKQDCKTGIWIYSGDQNIGPELFFSFTDKSDFTIYGNGALIKAHPDNPPIINMRGFEFIRCKNFKVENLNYDGSKNDRKPDGADPNVYNNQSGFKVSSSKKYELTDCRSDNCCMDGFFISSDELFADVKTNNWNEDGILRNCHADNNYRQGCSIVNSKRFKVIGGSYTNTGKTYGTSPKMGIDAEEGTTSDFGRGNTDAVFDGVLFENNENAGLALHFGTHDANVTNCVFKNNPLFVAPDEDALSCNNTIFNNNFYDSHAELRGGGEHFYGNRFYLSPQNSFHMDIVCKYPHFKNKKCRETLVYDNYIQREAGSGPIGQVAGSLTIGEYKDGVKVFNNTFINLASKDNFLFIYGPQDRTLEFYNNTFHNTTEFIANSPITNLIYTNIESFFKNAYNNKIEIPGISPMVSTIKKAQAGKLVRSFHLTDLPKNKFVDVTFDSIPSSFEARDLYLKVTTKGYWYNIDSTQIKEEIISLLDVKPISYTGTLDDFKRLPVSTGLYVKNNKVTLTFAQSNTDAAGNNLWALDIVIEVLGNYTDDFPVNISSAYDTNSQPLILNLPMVKSINQTDSSASDVATLRNDFNSLLLKLKNAGVMQD